MKSIREFAGQELLWKQLRMMEKDYELTAGEEVVATLRWEKMFGSLATATCAEGSWTFKRSGFLNPNVTVREAGSEFHFAVFDPDWRGRGLLELRGGPKFRWLKPSFWHSEWIFTDEAGQTLVHLRPRPAMVKRSADVVLVPEAGALRELPLLVTLGWYLQVLMSEDSAGGAAAGAAAAAAG